MMADEKRENHESRAQEPASSGSAGDQRRSQATAGKSVPNPPVSSPASLKSESLKSESLESDGWDDGMGLADTVDVSSTVDELVVYLDGYLDDAQRRRVEQRLIDDEEARTDLAQLQSAWDALDCLPRPECSEDFIESTMKLVVQRELVSQSPRSNWLRRTPLVLAMTALLSCSLGLGYLVAQRWTTAEERQFLESYRLIDNWEKYQTIGDFEFLLRLDKEGLFSREVSHVP